MYIIEELLCYNKYLYITVIKNEGEIFRARLPEVISYLNPAILHDVLPLSMLPKLTVPLSLLDNLYVP